jgi:hypothetical protein
MKPRLPHTRPSLLLSAALLWGGLLPDAGLRAQTAPPQSPEMSFFVTSVGLGQGGNLGGLAGADAHCQQLGTAAGAGHRRWRAYLSTQATATAPAVHARERIGSGPWQNFQGTVIAVDIEQLHADNNALGDLHTLTERGSRIPTRGFSPNYHDILTGSQADGRAFAGPPDRTCSNWTSSSTGHAMVGHLDKLGLRDDAASRSWNAAHPSRGCGVQDLHVTAGNGLFYCFAQN